MNFSELKFSRELEEQFVSLLGDIKEQYYNQGLSTGKKIGYTQGYTDGVELGRKEAYSEATELVGKKAIERFVQIFKEIDAIDAKIDSIQSPVSTRLDRSSSVTTAFTESEDTESDGTDTESDPE